jgi:hypothetical protein
MVECICIDDGFRPNDIPTSKWVKKGNTYHVIYTATVLPQNQLGFVLDEIDLEGCCAPYKFFLANRFKFKEEDIPKLMELIKRCSSGEELEEVSIDDLNTYS